MSTRWISKLCFDSIYRIGGIFIYTDLKFIIIDHTVCRGWRKGIQCNTLHVVKVHKENTKLHHSFKYYYFCPFWGMLNNQPHGCNAPTHEYKVWAKYSDKGLRILDPYNWKFEREESKNFKLIKEILIQ